MAQAPKKRCGLLSDEGVTDDHTQCGLVALTLAEIWNGQSLSKRDRPELLEVGVNQTAITQCCGKAATLFTEDSRLETPGPFKRMAAFVVLGQLYKLFSLKNVPLNDPQQLLWRPRFMLLCIPMLTKRLRLN